MLIREAMTSNIKTIDPKETVQEAARRMRKENVGALIVLGENDEVLGLITEGTIVREIVAQGKSFETKVEQTMVKNPYVIHPDRTLEEAAELMVRKHIKRLPVVEDDKVIGIITVTDLIAYEEKLVEKLAEMFIKEKQEAETDSGEVEVSS